MSTTEAEYKELAVELPNEITNKGNLDLIDEYFADDYVGRHSVLPEAYDREGFKDFVSMLRTAYPDLELTFEEVIAEGEKVVRRDRFTGTHEGELMGLPPTGKEVELQAIDIMRFEDGKVVDERYLLDNLELMEQLGFVVLPKPGLMLRMIVGKLKSRLFGG